MAFDLFMRPVNRTGKMVALVFVSRTCSLFLIVRKKITVRAKLINVDWLSKMHAFKNYQRLVFSAVIKGDELGRGLNVQLNNPCVFTTQLCCFDMKCKCAEL